MFKNKAENGRNNICGKRIATLRKNAQPKMSQRALADNCQLFGIDLDKNAIQRIESGQRFITDIEIICFCHIFKIDANELFEFDKI
ncbi:MAG: helix-turn-helix domain-containing protein [Christensenellaceae bacterium]